MRSSTMLQPRVIIFLAGILITEVCSVTDFENKVDGILKKVRQLKNIYSIHELRLSITRILTDDKGIIQKNLFFSLGKKKNINTMLIKILKNNNLVNFFF